MFLGINMFLALLRTHFNPRYARAKMSLSRAKNIFMPANINSIVILQQYIETVMHRPVSRGYGHYRPFYKNDVKCGIFMLHEIWLALQ